ncbi:unnamed protein product [Mucor hiemalis]
MPSEHAEQFFHYVPSKSLAVLSMLAFFMFSIIFATRIYTTKSATFLYIIPVVAFGEAIASMYRVINIDNANLTRYIIMCLFSILVPLALPLVNYMAVGQVIKHSRLPSTQFFLSPSFVSWFFIGSDIIHFWMQRLGELNTNTGTQGIGMVLFIVLTSTQSMVFAAFIFTAIYVHQNQNYTYFIKGIPNAKSRLMLSVYITFTLQYVRYIYRATEYVSGIDAAMNSQEWIFYTFDTTMVISCFLTYSILFIGNYLPQQNNLVDLKQDGEYVRVSDLGDEDLDNMIAEGKKHVAVFNNVQKVNYSISIDP